MSKSKKIFKAILISILILFVMIFMLSMIFISITISSVKNIDLNLSHEKENYTKILDANGEILPYYKNLSTNYIALSDIPNYTINAFTSIEDKEFFKHKGLNYKRIASATLKNVKTRSLKEGASTITQQLVKNKFLSNEKTFDRKIKEAYLSKKIEKQESKESILESYLNTIYFGNGAYGIGNASMTYFGKNPHKLTLSESAMLAGIIKSPNTYSPIKNIDKALKRRNLVLSEMLKDEVITKAEYDEAILEEIDLTNSIPDFNIKDLDLYTQFVLNEASEILNTNIYNVLHGGYEIQTFQDKQIQSYLNEIINDEKNYHVNSKGNIADSLSIILDNESNGIIAIAGKSKYNLVDIKRQPGSIIKPIAVYLPALEEGLIYSKSQVLDEKIDINGYSPNNVGNTFSGYVSVEDAVAKSLNIPAIKVAQMVGIDKCVEYAEKSGINIDENDYNYSAIALGGMTNGVSLKEITDSYSVLTHSGNYQKSTFISKITNSTINTIYTRNMSETNVYKPETSYLMTDILNYAVKTGTSKKLSKFNFDIAGKTGTVAVKDTNLNTDAYSIAYTSKHTMSVWLGDYTMNSKHYLEGKNNGGTYATQIICDTFDKIYKDNKPLDFVRPENIEEIVIDKKSLDEDHVLLLGDNVPERYQAKMLISLNNSPLEKSQKFDKIDSFEFKINQYKNYCDIEFNAYDYNDYYLYRLNDGKTDMIKRFYNVNGKQVYSDTKLQANKTYEYYIIAKSNYSDTEYKTNSKRVMLQKEYNEIVSNKNYNDNLSWLFR